MEQIRGHKILSNVYFTIQCSHTQHNQYATGFSLEILFKTKKQFEKTKLKSLRGRSKVRHDASVRPGGYIGTLTPVSCYVQRVQLLSPPK